MNTTSTDLGSIAHRHIMWRDVNIHIRSASPKPPPPPPPQPPRLDLLVGSRKNYIDIGVRLYEASICGDWQTAKAILEKRPELVRFAITENYETALHVAASAEGTRLMEVFVKNLVNLMDKKDLELQNKNYNTALSLAAAAGSVKVADIMVKKNKDLLEIPGSQGIMPLYLAALFGKHHMVRYLYDNSKKMTGGYWTLQNRGWVLLKCVEADMFDVALKIVTDIPELTSKRDVLGDALLVLARKSHAFNRRGRNTIWRIVHSIFATIHLKAGPAEKHGHEALVLLRIIWGKIKIMPKNEINDIIIRPHRALMNEDGKQQYTSGVLFIAAKMGNTRFVVELLRAYPDLIWKVDDDGLSIIHIAVLHRHEDIYNLLYEMGSMKDLITPLKDPKGNNMLHLVGMSSNKERPESVSGVPMLMQREIMWFKEVESMMHPDHREKKNNDGVTAYALFSDNNRELVSQGMKWINDCMVVAALIVTVAFAVAFTVPGGYNQENGIPMFIQESTFIVFVVADAVSLVSSSASLLMFLSIRTSPYGQRDFLVSLPRKLLIGIVTLLISVVAMLVTFSVSFFVLYHNRLKWVAIFISVLASLPLILFAALQHTLLADMFCATYDATYLFKPKKRMLYKRNKRF